ncbi:beta-glucuronidase isoform X1 [Nematostella vectensis]|uniref:beta-glucuronidase isoform X1 n=2 Tax=Nematostella vectensis TaxID=45351 RepID=UPI002076FB48|nr:beta-glucuronidase isoform X1 [Nematostella vectensis]
MSGTRTFFVVICCLTVIPKPNLADPLPGMLFPRESESRELKDLNGLWNFRVDSSKTRDAGFQEKWYSKPLEKSGRVIPMPVPASYNDITQEKSIRDFIGWAWYDMDTYVPQRWKDNSTRVVLRFESAHYYSIVWVNGEKVMEHEGGHLPFEADVSEFLHYDQTNRITAAINNTLTPTTLPPGRIQYFGGGGDWHPPGYFIQTYQFDFFNYAGIHRPVKLYTTPVVYLSDITITTSFSDNVGTVKFLSVVGAIKSIPRGDIDMKYELLDHEGFVVASVEGTEKFEGELTVRNPVLWWPIGMSNNTAYLYTLKISTSSTQSSLQDVYRLPVGIRTVRVEGTKFLFNNREFYFKGFGKHEDANIRGKGLDNVLIAKDFNLMKWLGGNSFRTSHYPYAEEIMDMADRTGIVVIDESPGVGIHYSDNFGPVSLKHHQEVMAELVRRDKNRPAVVMWSVANEPLSNLAQAEKYFAPIFSETRKLDPTRPVTFVTNFKAWSDKVVQFVDVILCNRYYAWYHDFGQTQLISRQLEEELMDWYKTFKKPVVQAEYGADTLAGLHSDPALMFTEEYQIESIDQYFPVFDKLRKEFLVGEMIWNFADFMTQQGVTRVVGNKKGILTRERQPKAAAFVLRQRYLNITLEQSPTSTGDELLDALVKFESRTPTTGNQ